MATLTVPAREGRAFEVARGGRFRIATPEGQHDTNVFIADWVEASSAAH